MKAITSCPYEARIFLDADGKDFSVSVHREAWKKHNAWVSDGYTYADCIKRGMFSDFAVPSPNLLNPTTRSGK